MANATVLQRGTCLRKSSHGHRQAPNKLAQGRVSHTLVHVQLTYTGREATFNNGGVVLVLAGAAFLPFTFTIDGRVSMG